jgi:hypothetical protein
MDSPRGSRARDLIGSLVVTAARMPGVAEAARGEHVSQQATDPCQRRRAELETGEAILQTADPQ